MTQAVVVGYGSIGQRHALWLKELGCNVAVVSQRDIDFIPHYKTLAAALTGYNPNYAVIANNTSEHIETLSELRKSTFTGKILVEKPLFKDTTDFSLREGMICYVAYNLRFHPVIQRLRSLISDRKVLQAEVCVGKYLPTWRAGERIGYSGNKQLGGGVLRDLSHELDYIRWILGEWTSVSSVCGHYSHLPITSDDCVSVLGVTTLCPAVSLQMNYLDRIGRRQIILHCNDITINADLLAGNLQVNDASEFFKVERHDTYIAQHKAILSDDNTHLCSFASGLTLMNVINAIEKASESKQWIQL